MTILAYTFMIMFTIIHSFMSGGFAFRSVYAYKVSNSVLEFIKNYFWSYTLTYKQIQESQTFIPEVNAKLEKLLSLALIEKVGVGYSTSWRDDGAKTLRIQKERLLDNSSETVHFGFQRSEINGTTFILTPSVFFLAQKVYEKLLDEEKNDKEEQRKNTI